MAEMLPNCIPKDTKSPGEPFVFDLLQKSPLTRNWTIFHSYDLPNHVTRISGEVDFVILVPDRGILCLEVKGHTSIERVRGSWYFGNDPQPSAKSPFKQAAEAAHTFREQLQKRLPQLKSVPVWSAVCMPYVSAGFAPCDEWHSWQIIDQRWMNREDFAKKIDSALQHGFDLFKQVYSLPHSLRVAFPESSIKEVVGVFRGDFEVLQSPKNRKLHLDMEVKKFTDEQYDVLDGLSHLQRLLVAGPAGTGKTALVLEEARRRAGNESLQILVVCFNSLLSAYLDDELQSFKNVTVSTISALMLSKAKMTVPTDLVGAESIFFWENTLPKVFDDRYISDGHSWSQFDVLIVDEAQDVVRTCFWTALDVHLKGGLKSGLWRVFGDPEKQALYGSRGELRLKDLESSCAFNLRVNCRNTPRVSMYAEILGKMTPPYRRVRRPDDRLDPQLSYYRSEADQVGKLTEILQGLFRSGYSGEEIVILSSRAEAAAVSALLAPPWSDRLVKARVGSSGRIRHCSIHSFKGMEAPVIILTDLDHTALSMSDVLFYVGITRTLHRLFLLIAESAKGDILKSLLSAPRRL